ncbi:MAG: hypothetical protein AAGI53_03610 [Planctomycetota bacterium]
MIMNFFALGLLLLMTYLWMARGLWSALIHFVCTLIAGAVAFGLWEVVAYFFLSISPDRGFLSFLEGIAWGAGLLLPFVVTLGVTRVIADSAVPGNVKNAKPLEYAGGIICGAGSSAITVGILVIAIGYTRVGSSFMGFRPVDYTEQRAAGVGSLERSGGLWIPVDSLVAGLYGHTSETSLRTGTPLAQWYPNVDVAGYANKISYGSGKSRNAMKPDDFQVLGAWAVGENTSVRDLLAFQSEDGVLNQGYVDLSGRTVSSGSLVGYTIRFDAGARESSGQVIFGNGQIRLLLWDANGNAVDAFPVALVSQGDAADAAVFGRWRFEGNETFIASVGGATTVEMGFEFVVPAGYQPKALYVKNTRVMVDNIEARRFPTPAVRDGSIASGALLGGGFDVADLDLSNSADLSGDAIGSTMGRGGAVIAQSASLGVRFQTTQKRGLTLDDDNRVTGGDAKHAPEELAGRGAIPRDLIVDKFAPGDDTAIVQIDVGPNSTASLLGRVGRSVSSDAPPQIIDTDGTAYQALGFIYSDNSINDIRFTPATPISGLGDLPTISGARTDQSLYLVFRVSVGVQMQYYALGTSVVFELTPPVEVVRR